MDKDNYLDSIRSAWLGEKFGQTFFSSLASQEQDESLAEKLRTLARLEIAVGNKMAALLESHGESPVTDTIIEVDEEILSQYTTVSHFESMSKMKTTIESALSRFDQLLAIAPDTDVHSVQFLVDHERALLSFVDKEIIGDGQNSLTEVKMLLGEDSLP